MSHKMSLFVQFLFFSSRIMTLWERTITLSYRKWHFVISKFEKYSVAKNDFPWNCIVKVKLENCNKFIKNVSSSTSHKKALRLSDSGFLPFFSSTFIYKPIYKNILWKLTLRRKTQIIPNSKYDPKIHWRWQKVIFCLKNSLFRKF